MCTLEIELSFYQIESGRIWKDCEDFRRTSVGVDIKCKFYLGEITCEVISTLLQVQKIMRTSYLEGEEVLHISL